MSDLRINSLFNRIKNTFIERGAGGGPGWGSAEQKNKKEKQEQPEKKDYYFINPENEKFFKLGKKLGLNVNEVSEALDLMSKATARFSAKTDTSTVLLNNDFIKYPAELEFISLIPEKVLSELEKTYPELHLAITDPFEFMCKFPKTVCLERYKKFSYQEILEFSSRCPEDYKVLSEKVKDLTTDEAP